MAILRPHTSSQDYPSGLPPPYSSTIAGTPRERKRSTCWTKFGGFSQTSPHKIFRVHWASPIEVGSPARISEPSPARASGRWPSRRHQNTSGSPTRISVMRPGLSRSKFAQRWPASVFGDGRRVHATSPKDLGRRSGLNSTLDAWVLECGRVLVGPQLLQPYPIRIDVGEERSRLDPHVPLRVSAHLLGSPLQEGHRPDEVAILRMMVGRTNLNQPLQEDPRLPVFLAPDLLEHFMGLEEKAVVEEPDRFLDRIQAPLVRCRHRCAYGALRNQLSRGRSLAEEVREGASSVRMISGAYVPRSVTTVVTRGPGVMSNRLPTLGPGQEAASKRASNFKVSHA